MHQIQPLDLLCQARITYSQNEITTLLGVDVRTVRRGEVRENKPPTYLADAIRQRLLPLVDTASTDNHPFTFIDLFAGIGSIWMGFEAHCGHRVFTSEWNTFSPKTYLANFPHDTHHVFIGEDITSVDENDVPSHDILLAFPVSRFALPVFPRKMPWAIRMVLNVRPKARCF